MVGKFAAAFNSVDENMSGALDFEEWKKFIERFKSNVGLLNIRSMFLHLDKVTALRVKHEPENGVVPDVVPYRQTKMPEF